MKGAAKKKGQAKAEGQGPPVFFILGEAPRIEAAIGTDDWPQNSAGQYRFPDAYELVASPDDRLILKIGFRTLKRDQQGAWWKGSKAELLEHLNISIREQISESKTPGYTGETMGDKAHDLNALAADLGFTFEQAAATLTEAAKAASDPLRRARRVLKSYERRRAKNPNLPESPEVKARSNETPGFHT